MDRLDRVRAKGTRLAIGLISGTSLDGVDAALVEIAGSGTETKLSLRHFITVLYPNGLPDHLLKQSQPGASSVDEICRINALLGHLFADAALELLRQAGVIPEQVDFIGSHGQTVYHSPEREVYFGKSFRSTLQLAEPSIIAKKTGIVTVADFRQADMALDGQGAPLVPLLDFFLFRSSEVGRAFINIGGIANITILPKGCRLDQITAFDTGPGNTVIDLLMNDLFAKPFDNEGETAFSGKVSSKLLKWLLGHKYFDLPPPKSTGREIFGPDFVREVLKWSDRLHLSPNDIVATATELTVRSIWDGYSKAPDAKVDELIISGGGVRNRALMQGLTAAAHGIEVKTSNDLGLPSDAKEAVCFAVLANETLSGNSCNVPTATGASEATVLGKICL